MEGAEHRTSEDCIRACTEVISRAGSCCGRRFVVSGK